MTRKLRVLSAKQREIIGIIVRANPDGTWVDLDQLIERLSYKPSKEAIQFSLRSLIDRGLIEKRDLEMRRDAERRIYAPTPKGVGVLKGAL